MYGSHEKAATEVEVILQKLDLNGSGEVDYSGIFMSRFITNIEFLLAIIDIPGMLTTEKLRAAFQTFDYDGSGAITIDEIQRILGGSGDPQEYEEWKQIVADIDKDGNGEISFDEFVIMM